MTDAGDCFEVAAHIAVLDNHEQDDLLLVHGLPIGRGDTNRGQRFWHAWVETPDGTVIDKANGLDVEIPKVLYYAIGNITEEHVWRYTPVEATCIMLDCEHFGPWVEGWEEMEEEEADS